MESKWNKAKEDAIEYSYETGQKNFYDVSTPHFKRVLTMVRPCCDYCFEESKSAKAYESKEKFFNNFPKWVKENSEESNMLCNVWLIDYLNKNKDTKNTRNFFKYIRRRLVNGGIVVRKDVDSLFDVMNKNTLCKIEEERHQNKKTSKEAHVHFVVDNGKIDDMLRMCTTGDFIKVVKEHHGSEHMVKSNRSRIKALLNKSDEYLALSQLRQRFLMTQLMATAQRFGHIVKFCTLENYEVYKPDGVFMGILHKYFNGKSKAFTNLHEHQMSFIGPHKDPSKCALISMAQYVVMFGTVFPHVKNLMSIGINGGDISVDTIKSQLTAMNNLLMVATGSGKLRSGQLHAFRSISGNIATTDGANDEEVKDFMRLSSKADTASRYYIMARSKAVSSVAAKVLRGFDRNEPEDVFWLKHLEKVDETLVRVVKEAAPFFNKESDMGECLVRVFIISTVVLGQIHPFIIETFGESLFKKDKYIRLRQSLMYSQGLVESRGKKRRLDVNTFEKDQIITDLRATIEIQAAKIKELEKTLGDRPLPPCNMKEKCEKIFNEIWATKDSESFIEVIHNKYDELRQMHTGTSKHLLPVNTAAGKNLRMVLTVGYLLHHGTTLDELRLQRDTFAKDCSGKNKWVPFFRYCEKSTKYLMNYKAVMKGANYLM